MTIYGRTIPAIDIRLIRGNAEPINLAFTEGGSALDLSGKTLRFKARLGSLIITKSTGDSGFAYTDQDDGQATLTLSKTESRSLPAGEPVPFEIENYTDQLTLLTGTITGVGGLNDD